MRVSPSIQEIASALAQTSLEKQKLNLPRTGRILCLILQRLPEAGFKRRFPVSSTETSARPEHSGGEKLMRAVAEAFLKYSPRVSIRSAPGGNNFFVFIDIASTSHLFAGASCEEDDKRKNATAPRPLNQGEENLMRSAIRLARDLGFSAQCAVADTPAGAQAFAIALPGTILPPGEERDRLKELSLPLLLHLEGLVRWERIAAIESIVTFFLMLGCKTIGDLSRFTADSFRERWGETGALIWKRIHAKDRQVVSPLVPTDPLEDYVHLDFPVSLVSLLLHQVQKSIAFLFARLQGRRLVAQRLTLILHCEYSNARHKIEIEPVTPSRDRSLFLTLIENRLNDLDLENPIRDFEIQVTPVPEKSQQLDFFEPRVSDQDKVETLMSLLTQSSLKPGFYQIEPSLLPEKGWSLTASPHERKQAKDLLEPIHLEFFRNKDEGDAPPAVAPRPHYGAHVMRAPRPTRLLPTPRPLSLEELERLKILSRNPIERLESGWWTSGETPKRDYYFAVSPEGQCLWIFQDPSTEEYFLHGYFD